MFIGIAGSFVACNLFLRQPNDLVDINLIAYFPFDKDANEFSKHQLKGKIYGATPIKGIKNNGYHFDGIDDYIEIENSNNLFNFEQSDAYSISMWVKPDTNQKDLKVAENDILSKWVIYDTDTTHLKTGYPFCIRYVNQKSGKLKGRWYLANWGGYIENCDFGNKIVDKQKITTTQFHHLVCTKDNTSFKLYVDGQLVATEKNVPMCSTKNNAPLRIGKRGGLKYQNHFAGIVDELRIYEVALSAEEVLELNRELKIEN